MSLDAEIARIVERTVREVLADVAQNDGVQREALTVLEVASSLGMSDTWVRTAVREHGMPAKKAGPNGQLLIPLGGLRAWLNGDES